MDSRNERNLLIPRHSPLAYIRNRIPPYFALSILFLSLDFLSMYGSLLSQLSPFFAVILACITSPPPLPFLASYYLVAKSFLCFHNDLLSASFFRAFFSASLSATHLPLLSSPSFHFESYSPEDNDTTKLEGWLR